MRAAIGSTVPSDSRLGSERFRARFIKMFQGALATDGSAPFRVKCVRKTWVKRRLWGNLEKIGKGTTGLEAGSWPVVRDRFAVGSRQKGVLWLASETRSTSGKIASRFVSGSTKRQPWLKDGVTEDPRAAMERAVPEEFSGSRAKRVSLLGRSRRGLAVRKRYKTGNETNRSGGGSVAPKNLGKS